VPAADTGALHEALAALRRLVDAAEPRLPAGGPERDARRRRLAWHLDEYLLPRVRDLDAPLVAVLLGSTGAGKSSLLNALAGRRVSPSGVTRPTTRRPVVLVAAADAQAFRGGRVLGTMAAAGRLDLVVDEAGFAGVALVDAPDLDSVETANREAADELLHAADLCVFVTTAQRYADAVPWEFLRRARERGVPLLVVANRLPRAEADRQAIMADCRRRFEDEGLGRAGPAEPAGPGEAAAGGPLLLLGVLEGDRDEELDGLRPYAVHALRERLARLAQAGSGAASAVKLQALRGALEGLPAAVGAVAADLEADERRAAPLRGAVARSYRTELAALDERLASGVFLRGEVMRAWQEFVGAGDVARALATGLGRLRAFFTRRRGRGGAAPGLEHAKQQAFEELVAALVRHADAAASAVAADWSSAEPAAALVADRPDLWGHGQELPARAREELTAWLGRLTREVRERGGNRRAVALAASVGVNALGVVTMLAVFAHSAGLTGGELAIAGGTAVVNQKLLEALFGEAAVRSLIQDARADLAATLQRVLDADAGRFLALIGPPEVAPAELVAAAARVLEEAGRLAAPGGSQGADGPGARP